MTFKHTPIAVSTIAAISAAVVATSAQARTLAVHADTESGVAITASATTIQVGDTLESIEARLQGFALLERVATIGATRVDYLVVRATIVGEENPGLVFENGVLTRVIGATDRKTFSACRSLATSRGAHWMQAGFEPYQALLIGGAQSVELVPPSTELSIARMVGDTTDRGMQTIETLSGLVPTAFNPSAVPKQLRTWVRTAREMRETSERNEVLRKFPVGMEEGALVSAIGIDWARVEGNAPLLWYRKEGYEVSIRDGRVAGVEFPARRDRIEKAAGGFYEAGIDWSRCPKAVPAVVLGQ